MKREGEERASFVGGSRALFFVVFFLGWFFFFFFTARATVILFFDFVRSRAHSLALLESRRRARSSASARRVRGTRVARARVFTIASRRRVRFFRLFFSSSQTNAGHLFFSRAACASRRFGASCVWSTTSVVRRGRAGRASVHRARARGVPRTGAVARSLARGVFEAAIGGRRKSREKGANTSRRPPRGGSPGSRPRGRARAGVHAPPILLRPRRRRRRNPDRGVGEGRRGVSEARGGRSDPRARLGGGLWIGG